MSTRAMGPMAGVRWLTKAINLGRHNPKAIFGAAGLMMLVILVPMLAVMLPLQFTGAGAPSTGRAVATLIGYVLVGLLVSPLYGGMLSIIDAAERGLPAKATDLFAPFRSGGGAGRMIGFAIGMQLVHCLFFIAIIGIAGTGIGSWYMQLMAAQGTPEGAKLLQQLPAGFGTAIAMFFVLWLLACGIFAVGFGQVVLAGRGPIAALKEGFVGSVKNLLPLLALVVSTVVCWFLVALVFAVLVLLAMLLGKLAGAWLGVVLIVPIYVAFLLTVFVVMFGVMYFMWRDVCGGSDATLQTAGAMAA